MEKTNLDASKFCCMNNEIECEGFLPVINVVGVNQILSWYLYSELNRLNINDISENIDIPYQTRLTVQDQYLKWKKNFRQ